jgi:hypothetical protein
VRGFIFPSTMGERGLILILLQEITSWDRLAGSNIYCAGTDPVDSCPKGLMSLRTKRSHLIYPCKQVTEANSKAQSTHGCMCMWLHWLFHFPSAMWPSCFNSLSFISLLCHPLPVSLSEHSLSVSFLPPFLLQYN